MNASPGDVGERGMHTEHTDIWIDHLCLSLELFITIFVEITFKNVGNVGK